MENKLNPKSSVQLRPQSGLVLHESSEAQAKLDNLLLACFSVQKMYGRQPENIEVINQVFHSILGKYPSDKVIKAFEIWMERSQEFPTPADISGLIKRNGKPPLSREIYISISKKDAEGRSWEDWNYLKDYEAQTHDEEWGDDEIKAQEFLIEKAHLKKQIMELKDEILKISDLLRKERLGSGRKHEASMPDKVAATVKSMLESGAPTADINEFIGSVQIPLMEVA